MKKPSRRFRLIVAALVVGVIGAPFLKNSLEQTGDLSDAQSKTEHQIVSLSEGKTHFEDLGTDSENCVFLVHGVSGPMSVWNKMAPKLSTAGHRVISYDLYGRGLSDRTKKPYDIELYRQQLGELIENRRCKGRVNLVGSSMGAIVVSDFAVKGSIPVNKVALIGPAGFPIKATPAAKLIQVPVIGDYLFAMAGKRSLSAHNAKYYADLTRWPEVVEDYAKQFKYSGYKSAILSTMREMPVQNFKAGYEALGNSDVSTLLIWGQDDVTFPVTNFPDASDYLQSKNAHIIQSAGHVPQYEQAEQTTKLLIEFLGGAE